MVAFRNLFLKLFNFSANFVELRNLTRKYNSVYKQTLKVGFIVNLKFSWMKINFCSIRSLCLLGDWTFCLIFAYLRRNSLACCEAFEFRSFVLQKIKLIKWSLGRLRIKIRLQRNWNCRNGNRSCRGFWKNSAFDLFQFYSIKFAH